MVKEFTPESESEISKLDNKKIDLEREVKKEDFKDKKKVRKLIILISAVAERLEGGGLVLSAISEWRKAGLYAEKIQDYSLAKKFYKSAQEEYLRMNHGQNPNYQGSVGYEIEKHIKQSRRNAALYRATEKMNPIIRGLIRRFKTTYAVLLLAISLLFFLPNVTGSVISIGKNIDLNLTGTIFFIVSLISFSLIIYKMKLSGY